MFPLHSFQLKNSDTKMRFSCWWCRHTDDVRSTGVKSAATPGSSATTPRWRSVDTRCTAWAWATPTASASGRWTAPASAGRPASLKKWPPSTPPRARGCKVPRKVNAKSSPTGHDCFLMLSFPATVIKIEGKYDIVIKDDELEGTVGNTDWSGFSDCF